MVEVEEMSFREKSALLSLLAVLFVFGGYFANLLAGTAERTLSAMLYTGVGVVVALIVIQIVFHVALASADAADANAPADERDRLISARAARISHLVLSIGIITVICRMVILGAIGEHEPGVAISHYEIANLLLFALVLSEAVHYGGQVFYYRRGITP